MAQYISIDNLQSKIEELKDYADEHWDNEEVKGINKFLDRLINSLEIKEVNLDAEIDKELETRWKGEYLFTAKFRESAKHFIELGMKVAQ